jgi:hypothetical protein
MAFVVVACSATVFLNTAILTDRLFTVADGAEGADHVGPVFVTPLVWKRDESHI